MRGAQPEIFQGRGGFVDLGCFDKLFVKNTRKKGPAGKIFSLNYIFNGRFNPSMDTIRAFFSKIRALFLIFK